MYILSRLNWRKKNHWNYVMKVIREEYLKFYCMIIPFSNSICIISLISNVLYNKTNPRFVNFLFVANRFIVFYVILTSDVLNADCEITPRGNAKQPCVTKILSHSCILTMSILLRPRSIGTFRIGTRGGILYLL